MNVSNLLNIYVSGWKREDRLSAYFSYLMYCIPDLFSQFIHPIVGRDYKILKKDIQPQVSNFLEDKYQIETQKNSMDIIIRKPFEFTIIIENKLTQRPRKGQISDYIKFAHREYPDDKIFFCLITKEDELQFVEKYKKDLEKEHRIKFVYFRWKDVFPIIEKVYRNIDDDRYRHFIKMFCEYMEENNMVPREFNGFKEETFDIFSQLQLTEKRKKKFVKHREQVRSTDITKLRNDLKPTFVRLFENRPVFARPCQSVKRPVHRSVWASFAAYSQSDKPFTQKSHFSFGIVNNGAYSEIELRGKSVKKMIKLLKSNNPTTEKILNVISELPREYTLDFHTEDNDYSIKCNNIDRKKLNLILDICEREDMNYISIEKYYGIEEESEMQKITTESLVDQMKEDMKDLSDVYRLFIELQL